MNILYWNTNKRLNIDAVVHLIIENNCDIASFAELETDHKQILRRLSEKGYDYYHVPIIVCDRIHIFTRVKPNAIEHLSESAYYTIKLFPHPSLGKIIIAFVHLVSKLRAKDFDQLEETKLLKNDIIKEEDHFNLLNTVVVGDFNMNPYEEGMLAAASLNAFPTKVEVSKGVRSVNKREYRTFYNPMWTFFGDRHPPFGTYYYPSPKHYGLRWNIFDQVLVRPKIIDHFDISQLKILTSTEDMTLYGNGGRPTVSDHFPIFFRI